MKPRHQRWVRQRTLRARTGRFEIIVTGTMADFTRPGDLIGVENLVTGAWHSLHVHQTRPLPDAQIGTHEDWEGNPTPKFTRRALLVVRRIHRP